MAAPISRTWPNGARQVFNSTEYVRRIERTTQRENVLRDLATCCTCWRTWDDGLSTGVTPTPAALCPFENA